MDAGTVIYRLFDYFAIESFIDAHYNTDPDNEEASHQNEVNTRSSKRLDASLEGLSSKQCLDFLAEHEGVFKKRYSTVKAIYAFYRAQDSSEKTRLGFDMPFIIGIPFEKYIELGRKEKISISLNAEGK